MEPDMDALPRSLLQQPFAHASATYSMTFCTHKHLDTNEANLRIHDVKTRQSRKTDGQKDVELHALILTLILTLLLAPGHGPLFR